MVELRSAGEPEHGNASGARLITELIYGKAGWLERLGFRSVEERSAAWKSSLPSRIERLLSVSRMDI